MKICLIIMPNIPSVRICISGNEICSKQDCMMVTSKRCYCSTIIAMQGVGNKYKINNNVLTFSISRNVLIKISYQKKNAAYLCCLLDDYFKNIPIGKTRMNIEISLKDVLLHKLISIQSASKFGIIKSVLFIKDMHCLI